MFKTKNQISKDKTKTNIAIFNYETQSLKPVLSVFGDSTYYCIT